MSVVGDKLLAAGSWIESLLSNRAWGIALSIGLAVLTVVLIVLMCTRWGQVRPISKCVALSIAAHVLLIGYAYGTRLIFDAPDAPPGAANEIVNLQIITEDDHQESQADTHEQLPAWKRFVAQEATVPGAASIQRRETDIEGGTVQRTIDDTPTMPGAPDAGAVAMSEPARPSGEIPEANVLRAQKPAPEVRETVEPIEQPQEADVQPIGPEASGLPRLPTPSPEGTLADRSITRDDVDEKDDIEQRQQRLMELARHAKTVEGALNQHDAARETTSGADTILEHNTGTQETQNDHSQPTPGTHFTTNRAEVASAIANDSRPALPDAASLPRRLGDGRQLPMLYGLRLSGDRLSIARQRGGNAETEAAVAAALKWLAQNQSPDGRWDADQFGAGLETRVLGHDRQGAGTDADTGITGLALLAFLAAGNSHLEGDYRRNVQVALEFLLRSQRADGNLAGAARLYAAMYCHSMAALAISEAYALTGDSRLKAPVQLAVGYSVSAQHPVSGGWRYEAGHNDTGDMSQFGWQVMMLKSAELAGMEIPSSTRAGMFRFLNNSMAGTHRGLARYRTGEDVSRTMTAEALFCHVLLGTAPSPEMVDEAASFILQQPPSDGKANYYYWYYATLAMYQVGGEQWEKWNKPLRTQLLSRQRADGRLAGSWDANSVWGSYGGRVYSTAMAALCLESYYRYLPMYQED